jgi:antitoxin YqcF
MATPISPEKKTLARHVVTAFAGKPQVRAYYSEDKKLTIDLLWCPDRPVEGVTSYSTIGLSDTVMKQGTADFPTRLEICGASAVPESGLFGNVLTMAAFMIMRSQRLVLPGTAIPEVVREYYPATTLPHLYFTAPFLWEDTLKSIVVGGSTVAWLLAIPISDAELTLLRTDGDDALETAFEKSQIDIYDLERASAV